MEQDSQASGVRRVNPRRPYVISPNGLKRIVVGSEQGSRELHLARTGAAVKPLRTTQAALRHMLVIVHAARGALDEQARQAIAAAALLADARTGVVVAVLGAAAEELGAWGADTVVSLPQADAARFAPELSLALAQALVAQYAPLHILLPDREADGDLGRRLAARSGLGIATDVVELTPQQAGRVLPGGCLAHCDLPRILLLARNVADVRLPFVGHGVVAEAPAVAASVASPVRDLGLEVSDPDQIGLEEADFIIAGGNGMRDMETFVSLAGALGAVTGASRVAVDDGRFPRARQIGATGKTVQASVYMALGISGAVQHLQGIKDCRHVVAVNLDESAPIARRADLTLVEDTQALMRALLPLVRAARQAKEEGLQ